MKARQRRCFFSVTDDEANIRVLHERLNENLKNFQDEDRSIAEVDSHYFAGTHQMMTPTRLEIESDDWFNILPLVGLIEDWQKETDSGEIVFFEWAEYSGQIGSVLTPGGGAAVIYKGVSELMTTEEWMYEKMEELTGDSVEAQEEQVLEETENGLATIQS